MTSVASIKSFTLDLPPSCIAFCPTQPDYFVVGTYYLQPTEQAAPSNVTPEFDENADGALSPDVIGTEQGDQKRTGSLLLFRLHGETMTQINTLQTDYAILDVQWTTHKGLLGGLLALATSTGYIAFYRLEAEHGDGHLLFLGRKVVADPSVLVLSLAWHPHRSNIVGFTLSNGNVSLCESAEDPLWNEHAMIQVTDVHRHELEAWTLAFEGNGSTNVISGGDDIVLQCSNIDNRRNGSTLWRDRKLHQAGITAILPLRPDLVVTGSYDDHIRLISAQSNGKRELRAELNLNGGVWRLKLIGKNHFPKSEGTGQDFGSAPEFERYLILASCMHAGSRIVRLCKGGEGEWTFDVIAKFEEHQSMNYGSDVQPGHSTLKSMVSTSFYDKLLCVWQFDTRDIEVTE